MKDSAESRNRPAWLSLVPPARWLAEYHAAWLPENAVAGVTLAAYAIPVSLAYAGLAGLPPQVGVYGYLLGGLGYALLGSSRQLAIGPTSAISLMIAGTVGAMAEGDAHRYAQIASLAGFTVAALCLIAWLLRLSGLVKLISDSILVGFKAGAALTIAMTQLPSLLGVTGGGHNFFERAVLLAAQLGQMNLFVFALGVVAIMLLVFGERLMPGRPIALGVVALSIVAASVLGLPALGVATTGEKSQVKSTIGPVESYVILRLEVPSLQRCKVIFAWSNLGLPAEGDAPAVAKAIDDRDRNIVLSAGIVADIDDDAFQSVEVMRNLVESRSQSRLFDAFQLKDANVAKFPGPAVQKHPGLGLRKLAETMVD